MSQTASTAKEEVQGAAEGGRQQGIEERARRDARRLLERQKRIFDSQGPYEASGRYKPITLDDALGLAEKIIPHDGDEEAYAFITLLHGLAAAAFAERREGYRGPTLEGLVIYATQRAYTRTMHFADGVTEFAYLDPATFEEIDALRSEYFGEEGGEK